MPKKYRLSRADFLHMRTFKRLHGGLFSYSYGEIPGRSTPGAACVISKKVASRAVDRNRIKRQVRPAIATLLEGVKSPIVIVCHAKRGAKDARSNEIVAEILSLSKKLFR